MFSDLNNQASRFWRSIAERAPRRRGRTLAGRLFMAVVATTLLVYVAAVAGIWWTGGRVIADSARKQAVQWLADLDEQGTPIYASRQHESAMRALTARLEKVSEIAYVRYYDASGKKVLGEYTKNEREIPSPLATDFAATAQESAGRPAYHLAEPRTGRVRVTAPVLVRTLSADALLDISRAPKRESAKVIGYIDFVFDARLQYQQFRRSLLGGSVALALVLCIAVVLGRRAVQHAMAPLTALQEPLARLARGDMNVEMGDGGDREIAAIRDALNSTISALKEREEALRRAESDSLTGLVNQRYFERQLVMERHRVERDAECSAVLCVELDRFAEVTTQFGDAAGDRLLGQVAGLLRARIRENDLLSRFDNNAFVAIIRGVNRDGSVKVARSINQVMQEFQFTAGEELFPVSVSIGIAMLDSAHPAAEAVLAHAAVACAQAKTRGGNGYCMHEADEVVVTRESDSPAWIKHVRTAIQDNALKLMYQPIIDLHAAGGVEMYELLLRLKAPGGQLVSPTAFLPVADRFGLMAELDYWVVREACAELARVNTRGRSVTFFVNLSGQVFEEGETLVKVVREELVRNNLDGKHVVFEITEQAAIRQLDQARRVIEQLHGFGCRFALDDFGSGFSSLNYLKHLPVSFIKISGAFVQNMLTDALDEVMVRSVVQIADALQMQTVAESVEDRQTLLRITELGVNYGQGYVIARPAEQVPATPVSVLRRTPRHDNASPARPASSTTWPSLIRKR